MSRVATSKSPLRRAEPRTEATHVEIHGIATRHQGREQGPFVVWDISDNGLQLWLPDHVDAGEVIRLTIAKPFLVMVSVEVRWCKSSSDGSGFHVGVRALDNLGRLEMLHRQLVETGGTTIQPR